jgi:hypothetical protein
VEMLRLVALASSACPHEVLRHLLGVRDEEVTVQPLKGLGHTFMGRTMGGL